ncbi:ChbG/HpnK family deacetylase [Legionella lytica]|uniref:ChbG/HpnK family deacetylase n=1 Tax=Legionella lytica TaxID=96232 RepID=A0ABY4YAA5_9GAMM|nr:ChbG/HpnK family deacetylase [Legionella lytica]USQ14419.1 ChbG/HpnK family deacetylase [Legionella lytica]
MSEIKSIRLCADDFGLNPGVSQGILKLAKMGRLSAVSCMVNMPSFPAYAQELLALHEQVQIGLHFNLTEGNFLSMPDRPCFSLNELLIKSHLASIKLSFIAQEFKQQLAQFVHVMGKLPDFVDGHQHVHQFPRIRQVIVDLYDEQLRQHGTSIRSTYPTVDVKQYRLKAKILAFTGGRALRATLAKAAIPHNIFFSGIYDFAAHTDYRSLFRSWLHSISGPTLIMCHPGEHSNEPDVIAATRTIEMNYFSSNEFLHDCQEYGVALGVL